MLYYIIYEDLVQSSEVLHDYAADTCFNQNLNLWARTHMYCMMLMYHINLPRNVFTFRHTHLIINKEPVLKM